MKSPVHQRTWLVCFARDCSLGLSGHEDIGISGVSEVAGSGKRRKMRSLKSTGFGVEKGFRKPSLSRASVGTNEKSWAPAQREAMMKDDQGKLHLSSSSLKSIQLLPYYPKRINFSRKRFCKCLVFRCVKIIKFSWLTTRQCIFSHKASYWLYTDVVFWGIKV